MESIFGRFKFDATFRKCCSGRVHFWSDSNILHIDNTFHRVDLDIESGSNSYTAFVNRIRSHTNGASKT